MVKLAPEKYRCPFCGLKFRYKMNYRLHTGKCTKQYSGIKYPIEPQGSLEEGKNN